jgi:hypothetical protein
VSATLESLQHEPDQSYDEHTIESSVQPAPPPPNFHPFFTLIEDPITNEHHHPTVHYIFADDDADIITEAACRSLEESQVQDDESQSQAIASEPTTSRYLPPPVPGLKEHYLVLDVHPTNPPTEIPDGATAPGLEVSQAHSLSSEWQVLRTRITQAPTIGDSKDDEEGLMLRIEGRGDTPENEGKEKAREKEGLEELIERFQRRLEDVRLVMDGGGGKEG